MTPRLVRQDRFRARLRLMLPLVRSLYLSCVATLVAVAAMTSLTVSAGELAVVTHVDQQPLYRPQEIRAGGMRTEVYGTPITGATPAQIVAPLRGPGWAGSPPLQVIPEEEIRPHGRRLVLVFNGATPAGHRVCHTPGSLGGGESSGPLRVTAVYCAGPKFITRGVLSAGAVPSLDHPAYERAMSSLFAAIFPPHNPVIRGPAGG